MAIFKWSICVLRLKILPPTGLNYHFPPSCLHVVLLLVSTSYVISAKKNFLCYFPISLLLTFAISFILSFRENKKKLLSRCIDRKGMYRVDTQRACFCPWLIVELNHVKQAGYARLCVVEDGYVALLDQPWHEHDHLRGSLAQFARVGIERPATTTSWSHFQQWETCCASSPCTSCHRVGENEHQWGDGTWFSRTTHTLYTSNVESPVLQVAMLLLM
jgi:hypothetical protein